MTLQNKSERDARIQLLTAYLENRDVPYNRMAFLEPRPEDPMVFHVGRNGEVHPEDPKTRLCVTFGHNTTVVSCRCGVRRIFPASTGPSEILNVVLELLNPERHHPMEKTPTAAEPTDPFAFEDTPAAYVEPEETPATGPEEPDPVRHLGRVQYIVEGIVRILGLEKHTTFGLGSVSYWDPDNRMWCLVYRVGIHDIEFAVVSGSRPLRMGGVPHEATDLEILVTVAELLYLGTPRV